MPDRPLAVFENGQLYMDEFGNYKPASRFAVMMKGQVMSSLRGEHAAQKARECKEALDQYDRRKGVAA